MLIEREDAFEIAGAGSSVAACSANTSSLQLDIHAGEVQWTLFIEGTACLTRAGEIEPVGARLTALADESLILLRARKCDGQLEAIFTHDWILTVCADAHHEAWELFSNEGDKLIAVPGGGIAVWRAVRG